MSCATELLHPANFCPVCGARLAAPAHDGSAATLPGGTTPQVVVSPPDSTDENVVYLTEDRGIQPGPPGGVIAPNRHAHEYDGVEAPPQPPSAGPTRVPDPTTTPPTPIRPPAVREAEAQLQAALPAFGSHGPLPQQHELVPPPRVEGNPYGDFFSDGPSAWLEDDPEDDVVITSPRLLGTLLATGAALFGVTAWVIWGIAMYRGFGGAEAGAFVLLSMLLWVWYLSLPRTQQHAFMLRRHAGVRRLVERRTTPLRDRTEGSLSMRRERQRYRAMRDERTRRVNALGEAAYRAFRRGQLQQELHAEAQRIIAMERQMLIQDHRIHSLALQRGQASRATASEGGHDRAEAAAEPPEGGQPPG